MTSFTLEAPTDYARNSGQDSALPPDRFTQIPGNGNYRGGKIASYQQLKMLRDTYGIRTIVNLAKDSMRYQKSGDGFECYYAHPSAGDPCEPKWAAALGLKYIYAPMGGSPPDDSEWLAIQQALIAGHTYVHCTHGVDRTGAVAGRWVAQVTGMPTDQLLSYTYGFGGQWKMPSDPNHKLRTWLVAGQHDPTLAGRLSRGVPWVWIGIGGGALVLGAVIYRVRFK